MFATSPGCLKFCTLIDDRCVALVIGSQDEFIVQCEGISGLPSGPGRIRCLDAYFQQYPVGREHARDLDIVHVRVRPSWLRYHDCRPDSFQIRETRCE